MWLRGVVHGEQRGCTGRGEGRLREDWGGSTAGCGRGRSRTGWKGWWWKSQGACLPPHPPGFTPPARVSQKKVHIPTSGLRNWSLRVAATTVAGTPSCRRGVGVGEEGARRRGRHRWSRGGGKLAAAWAQFSRQEARGTLTDKEGSQKEGSRKQHKRKGGFGAGVKGKGLGLGVHLGYGYG